MPTRQYTHINICNMNTDSEFNSN